MNRRLLAALCIPLVPLAMVAAADPLPPSATYRNLPSLPFATVKANDEAMKAQVLQRQRDLLNQRYDLSDHALAGAMMSGGRKAVQGGVRVKLPGGTSWEALGNLAPEEIRSKGLLPAGFLPLPHVKQAAGGQVFP